MATLSATAGPIEERFRPPPATAVATAVAFDHSAWTGLLAKYVKTDAAGLNRVKYASFKKTDRPTLKRYLASLEAADVASLSRAEQFAFWVNLYNAVTIRVVLDAYPIKSIKDIRLGGSLKALVSGGPWQAKTTRVGGLDLSLDDIEHVILRGLFADPRVHYAVNCASIGCPNLAREAYTGADLERQLDKAARDFIASPRAIAVAGGRVTASRIFEWFQGDFGGSPAAVLEHARRYASPELKRKLEGITTIAEFDYNWVLNDAGG